MEASIMAVFSLSALRSIETNRAFEASRDAIIIIVAFLLCYKVEILKVFRETGIKLPAIFDTIISTLVLARMTLFIRQFMSRLRRED